MNAKLEVIDLRARFGDRYRVIRDESGGRSSTDPWYWIIPGKHGEIYPHGGRLLAVMVTSKQVAFDMRKWPELQLYHEADDAVIFIFDVEHFQAVAKRIRARRKARVSEKQRRQIEINTSASRFPGKFTEARATHSSQQPRSRPEATPGTAKPQIVVSEGDL